jgi:uncharacterized protein (TIGR03437 family)
VKKLSPDGSALLYTRYIGGSTAANSIALDKTGKAYVAGYSIGNEFPAVHPLPDQPAPKPMYVTHDAGHTWRALPIGSVAQINSLAIDPARPETLYAATSKGFYKSTDAGANWSRLLASVDVGVSIVIDLQRPSVLYAQYSENNVPVLARSSDAGADWTTISTNFPATPYPPQLSPSIVFAIDPSDSNVLWALTSPMRFATVLRSRDAGDHWETVYTFSPDIFQSPTLAPQKLLIDPRNNSRLYACCVHDPASAGTGGVYRSDDGGHTWVQGAVGPLGGSAGIQSPWLDPANSGVLYGTWYYGLERSDDAGMTWAAVPLPPGSATNGYEPGGLALDTSATMYLVNDYGTMLRSSDRGATWSRTDGPWTPQATILAIDPRDSSTIYVSSGAATYLPGGPEDVRHAFAAKLDASGAIEWATLLGGSGKDEAGGIAVDAAGNAYITGSTNSDDFPLVNPVQSARAKNPNFNSTDAFISKISSDGSKLLYSTYLGGPGMDAGNVIALDTSGSVYVGGGAQYGAFPTKGPVLTPAVDDRSTSFLAKLDPSGGKLIYSIVLTSSPNYPVSDQVNAISIDANGRVVVAGVTGDGAFPLVNPAQLTMGLGSNFIARLNPAGDAYDFSTYLGELHEDAFSIALTPGGAFLTATAAGLQRIDFNMPPTQPGVPSIHSLYNAASYKPGDVIAPGEIVTIMGEELAPAAKGAESAPLPRAIDGVAVSVGGMDAPLFYVSPQQINFQAPFELPEGSATLVVRRDAQQSQTRNVQVIPQRPGLFPAGPDPRGDAVVVHASDFSLVTRENPAHTGEYLAAFCTGLGATNPPAPTGDRAPGVARVKANVDAYLDSFALMQVSYAGLAPGWIGLYQVNFRVNDNAEPGRTYLHLQVGGQVVNQGRMWVGER